MRSNLFSDRAARRELVGIHNAALKSALDDDGVITETLKFEETRD